jgi:transposase
MRRLRDEQWDRIREPCPEEHIPDTRPGRKPVPARNIVEAVLWILNTGAQWHMLPQCYPNYNTVRRRCQQWCQREVLREILTQLANTLREEGALDERESFIDATFAAAKGGGDAVGLTKRGKGVKILAIVDRHGLPLSVRTHAAKHHEVTLVQLSFDFYMLEAKPEHLIGDRAYDSDGLDADRQARRHPHDCPTSIHPKAQEPGGAPLTPVPTPLARRTVLCLVAVAASVTDSLGVLRHQLSGLCVARLHHHAPQTILR